MNEQIREYFVTNLINISEEMHIPITKDHIYNYVFLGTLNGKETSSGWQSASDLGISITQEDVDFIESIYEEVMLSINI